MEHFLPREGRRGLEFRNKIREKQESATMRQRNKSKIKSLPQTTSLQLEKKKTEIVLKKADLF